LVAFVGYLIFRRGAEGLIDGYRASNGLASARPMSGSNEREGAARSGRALPASRSGAGSVAGGTEARARRGALDDGLGKRGPGSPRPRVPARAAAGA